VMSRLTKPQTRRNHRIEPTRLPRRAPATASIKLAA
jgi:hypothetical protein